MASGYTANYGLCQWQPSDKFLREEFNGDNAKIDAAIAAAAAQGSQALAGLEPLSQNVYSLILRDYYEKLETGWKKALLFDGFLDNSRIQSLTGGLTLGDKRLSLQGVGMGNVNLDFNGGRGSYIETTRTITATSSATMGAFTYEIYNSANFETEFSVNYTLTINGSVAVSGQTKNATLGAQSSTQRNVVFYPVRQLKKGDTISLKLNTNSSALLFSLSSGGGLGGIYLIYSESGTEGRMTSVEEKLPAASRVLGWVRHQGGTVGVSVADSTGTEHLLALTGARDSTSLYGETCLESSFALTEDLPDGTWSVLLDLTLGEDKEAHIFDYGVAWL